MRGVLTSLPIDVAYFVQPRISLMSDQDLEKSMRIYDCILNKDGIGISIDHHFMQGRRMGISALFPQKVPSHELISDVMNEFESVQCKQIITMGATTLACSGVTLFEGEHAKLFHTTKTNENISGGTVPPLEIKTGVVEIDRFFNRLLLEVFKKYKHNALTCVGLLEKLTKTLNAVREWLDEAERVPYRNVRFKLEATDIVSNKRLCSMRNAFEDFYNAAKEHIDSDIINSLKYSLDEVLYRDFYIESERKEDQNSFPPIGKRMPVSERLQYYREQNQKQFDSALRAIETTGTLISTSLPLYFAYRALMELDFISYRPVLLVSLAMGLDVLVLLLVLISFLFISAKPNKARRKDQPKKKSKKQEIADMIKEGQETSEIAKELSCSEKFVDRVRKKVDQPTNFGWYRDQRRYSTGEEFSSDLNNSAAPVDQVVLTRLDMLVADEIVSIAKAFYWRVNIMKVSVLLYMVSIILYAFGGIMYAIMR